MASQIPFADILIVLGRVLLGALFVIAGTRHFFILPVLSELMAARGVPAARFAVIAGSIFQIVAGIMLIVGIAVAWSAIGLVLFTVAASILFVNFWDMDGAERDNAKNICLSNMAIIGGLLIAAAQSL
jgi:putative oxidoreductase